MKLQLKQSRGNNSESMKAKVVILVQELSFLYTTHRQDLFYITVKYHDNIPKGIQVMEQTGNCI